MCDLNGKGYKACDRFYVGNCDLGYGWYSWGAGEYKLPVVCSAVSPKKGFCDAVTGRSGGHAVHQLGGDVLRGPVGDGRWREEAARDVQEGERGRARGGGESCEGVQ